MSQQWYLCGGGVREDSLCGICGPVVVIDPEDREQVERLAEFFWASWSGCDGSRTVALQEALALFANPKPPKPEEPTGLGAVVKDASGLCWVRLGYNGGTGYDDWKRAGAPTGDWITYAEIDAVTVLSPGVPE